MKKVYILISLIMLLVTFYEVANTFAKYTSEAEATAEIQAGAWVIEINSSDVSSSNSNRLFIINSLTYPSNAYVLSNKIAPSSSGYFDIIFDASGTSVAVRYDVTIDFSALDISDAIDFDSATVLVSGGDPIPLVRTGENTYSGIISLSNVVNERSVTTRYYLSWVDDATGQNDEEDSRLGVLREITNFNLPVSVVISQYSGEQLVQYE